MISIQQMQYLVVLSEEKQFQRASERCFVTQPTLSMQVKKAEEMLGFPIFDRSTFPMELTPFGENVISISREILEQMNQLEIIQQQMKGEFLERIRIGVIPTISNYLDAKSIDLAILAGPVIEPKWRTVPLYIEEIMAYIPSFNEEKLTTEYLDQLHPWLLNKGNCLRTQMMQFCQIEEREIPDQWNYEGGSIDMLIKMVDLNGGYTLVPKNHVAERQTQKGFHSIFSTKGNQNPAREVIALLSNKSYKKNILEELIREVQHSFKDTNQRENYQIINWK
jgi:LysR family hydrogen peroxide-inducible transcriptional activator